MNKQLGDCIWTTGSVAVMKTIQTVEELDCLAITKKTTQASKATQQDMRNEVLNFPPNKKTEERNEWICCII